MGCKVQYRKQSSQRAYMHDPWTWATRWGLSEVVRGAGWRRQRGKIGTTVIA